MSGVGAKRKPGAGSHRTLTLTTFAAYYNEELDLGPRASMRLRLFRFFGLVTGLSLYATQSYSCAKRDQFGLADFLFADVVIEARVVGYRPNLEKNDAYLDLATISTLKGFAKERWTVELRPFSDRVPTDNRWSEPVIIPLRGRISETGEFAATIIEKACAPLAIFRTDSEPGGYFKANLGKMFAKSPQ